MSTPPFVHLHCHSHYSLLDGAAQVPALVARAKELGMPALALTDHGNLFGAVEFFREAQAAGVQPILGYEAYVAPGRRSERDAKGIAEASYHLTLLAATDQGFRNLMYMASQAYLDGFYYRPRIDKELLTAHHDGIICLSGCASGEFSNYILKEQMDEATELARWFARLFGEANFYIEIQDNGLDLQRRCRDGAVDIARKLGLPLVATCDTHYLRREDAEAHDVLLCINTAKLYSDTKRMRMDTDEFYLRSPEEMYERFADYEEALRHTLQVAERCHAQLDFKTRHFPPAHPPEGLTNEQYLRQLCEEGLRKRYGDPPRSDATERLERELEIICRMGFAGYFLVVWDFVRFANEKGIPCGARGSACGAIVSYVLGLSQVDPLEYDLLFERFLDPKRSEAPDIDIDFCQERRDEVIEYVKEKYGAENVAQIITFGTMAARAVLRDVGRVLDMPLARVDQIVKLVPEVLNISLEEALKQSTELKKQYESDPQVKRLADLGIKLEGLNRHASTHAAGVVIADRPLVEYAPLQKNGDDVTTQWTMGDIEKVGLLKMDFLGLRNLTVLDRALRLIERTRGVRLDMAALPLDDRDTYRLLQSAETKGVFQLDAPMVRDILRRMRPDCFRDIIAVNALNRPATLSAGMVDVYVNRKHGREKATYAHPVLEEVLAETQGVMVYQEQVMRILNRLGGIELSAAYACIKAISKKKPDVIAKNKEQFTSGAQQHGLSAVKAAEIFELIVAFGGYGFNKSHSAAYALIAYQTAYLKAHYPAEYMAALLSSEADESNRRDEFLDHLNDARRMGLEILPPDVNSSGVEFTVDGKRLGVGLATIKGIGRRAVEAVVQARNKGPFRSLFDFCDRIDSRTINKGGVESLIKAGAFDSMGARRAQLMAVLPRALQGGSAAQEDRRRGQKSLFGDDSAADEAPAATLDSLPDVPEWSADEKLAGEKAVLGFYVSGHPLVRHEQLLATYASHQIAALKELSGQHEVVLGGMISGVKFGTTKKPSRNGNSRMAKFTFEDLSGHTQCVIFPDDLARHGEFVVDDYVCFLVARINTDSGRDQLEPIVSRIVPLERATEQFSKAVVIKLQSGQHNRNHLELLRDAFRRNPGPAEVYLEVARPEGEQVKLRCESGVGVSRDLLSEVESIVGSGRIRAAAGGNGARANGTG
jgi:DNA polymerase-3 subunit alpha